MARSQYGPAAGASGGPKPLEATFFVPRWLRLDEFELNVLLHQYHDPLVTQVFLLVAGHSVFETGEFLGGYARLIALCTPPRPQRGPRREGPSMWQLRRAVDDLVHSGMAWRGEKNLEQGQLRLRVRPRKNPDTPAPIDHKKPRRL